MNSQPAPAATSINRNGLARFWRLCRKELRESLRDRRTIITLVLMPLMVYPILSIIFQRFLLTNTAAVAAAGIVIGVDGEEDASLLQAYLGMGHAILMTEAEAAREPTEGVHSAVHSLIDEVKAIQCVVVDNPTRHLAEQQIDLAIDIEPFGPAIGPFQVPMSRLAIQHQPSSPRSNRALGFVDRYINAINRQYIQHEMQTAGHTIETPVNVVRLAVEDSSAATLSLASLVPLILILMTITGAVYPAIDLTAGERERGTLEALIAAPVSRFHLLGAKYTAVITVALLTAAANLIAMTVTLYSSGIAESIFGKGVLTFETLAMIFLLLVLFASFFSGVLLCVTSFARSFKEAQAYLIPLMLLSLAPGLVCLIPGLEFKGFWTVTPLVNIVLLARDIFQGSVAAAPAAAAIVSTMLYAAGALAVAARIFGTDAVLYGSQAAWSDWWQRPLKTRPAAGLSSALLFLAMLFPAYILLAGVLSQLGEQTIAVRLGVASLITVGLFGVLPLLAALLGRIRIIEAFHLRPTSMMAFLAAGLLGVSLWPLVHELFLLHRVLGVASLSPEQIEAVRTLVDSWHDTSPLFILLTMAIVPAVFEELFFRGFLFSALLNKLTPRKAILISAVLFGVFHVVVTSALSLERFVPSTFMGIVLGWVCWKTGSVFPGMLLHACHNGLLVSVGYYQDWLAAHRWGVQEQIHLPVYWLGFAVIGTVTGILVLQHVVAAEAPPDDPLILEQVHA